MHPNKSIPEPWLSFLRELDSAVREEVRLDCMEGFVVTMVYGFSRPTGDLDVLEIAPRDAGRPMLELGMQGGPLHKKYKIYLDHVGVAHVPENYEDRLCPAEPRFGRSHVRQHLLLDLSGCCFTGNARRDRASYSTSSVALSITYCDFSSWIASTHRRRVRSSRSGLPSCQRSSF